MDKKGLLVCRLMTCYGVSQSVSYIRVSSGRKKRFPMLLSDLSSKNSLRVYWSPGLAVGDAVAAGCGAKLLLMRSTLSGVVFQASTRIFQSSASRT